MTHSTSLRVVFMGTPEFAVSSLEAIRSSLHHLVGVVTVPDRPAGRGQKLQMSDVKTYCLEHKLPVMQPESLTDNAFVKKLHSLRADVFVVVAFKLLPKMVFGIPKFGTFNCHASLLPDYRGAAPINWVIINGERETGVTTFFIDDKIDTGSIIEKTSTPIADRDNAGSLHDKLKILGSQLVVSTLDKIAEGSANPVPQTHSNVLKKAPKLNPENRKIDWSANGRTIVNLTRGLAPYPCAWTNMSFDNSTYSLKISEIEFEAATHRQKIGSVICEKKTAKVAVHDGYIILKKLQFQGKKMLDITDLLNGSALKTGCMMG